MRCWKVENIPTTTNITNVKVGQKDCYAGQSIFCFIEKNAKEKTFWSQMLS